MLIISCNKWSNSNYLPRKWFHTKTMGMKRLLQEHNTQLKITHVNLEEISSTFKRKRGERERERERERETTFLHVLLTQCLLNSMGKSKWSWRYLVPTLQCSCFITPNKASARLKISVYHNCFESCSIIRGYLTQTQQNK